MNITASLTGSYIKWSNQPECIYSRVDKRIQDINFKKHDKIFLNTSLIYAQWYIWKA